MISLIVLNKIFNFPNVHLAYFHNSLRFVPNGFVISALASRKGQITILDPLVLGNNIGIVRGLSSIL